MSQNIRRPLWRSFTERFLANAVEHVRAGGHAVVRRPAGAGAPVSWLLLPCGTDGEIPELAYWAILALDREKYDVVERGHARGLATLRVPRAVDDIVEWWCERDARWPGATHDIVLDCVACASCCRDNNVVLDDDDVARWKRAGRADLLGPAYVRRSDGVLKLRLVRDAPGKPCVHLKGTLCGIYDVRPDPCSSFPAGSECCLASRFEELGLID